MKKLFPVIFLAILFSCGNEKKSSIQSDDNIIVNSDNPNVVINDSISNTQDTLTIDTNLSNKANFIVDTNSYIKDYLKSNYKTFLSHENKFSECPIEINLNLIDDSKYERNLTNYLIRFYSKIEKKFYNYSDKLIQLTIQPNSKDSINADYISYYYVLNLNESSNIIDSFKLLKVIATYPDGCNECGLRHLDKEEFIFNNNNQLIIINSTSEQFCNIPSSTPYSDRFIYFFFEEIYFKLYGTGIPELPDIKDCGLNKVCYSLSELKYQSEEIESTVSPPYQFPTSIDLIYPYKHIELFYRYINDPKDTNLTILSEEEQSEIIDYAFHPNSENNYDYLEENYEDETYDSIAGEVIGINTNNDTTIYTSFQSFLNNISDNNTYYVNIDAFDLFKLDKFKNGKHYSWKTYIVNFNEYDKTHLDDWGSSLVFNDLENVKIIGKNLQDESYDHSKTKILTTNLNSTVLIFENCKNVTISDFWIGHIESSTSCTHGVLAIRNSSDIVLNNCHLYGTGVEGVSLFDSRNVFISNSKIFDCSESIGRISNCNNVKFKNCKFYKNRGSLHVNGGANIGIVNCVFSENICGGISIFNCNKVNISNCLWKNNSILKYSNEQQQQLIHLETNTNKINNINFSNCSFYHKNINNLLGLYLYGEKSNKKNFIIENNINFNNVSFNDTLISITNLID